MKKLSNNVLRISVFCFAALVLCAATATEQEKNEKKIVELQLQIAQTVARVRAQDAANSAMVQATTKIAKDAIEALTAETLNIGVIISGERADLAHELAQCIQGLSDLNKVSDLPKLEFKVTSKGTFIYFDKAVSQRDYSGLYSRIANSLARFIYLESLKSRDKIDTALITKVSYVISFLAPINISDRN